MRCCCNFILLFYVLPVSSLLEATSLKNVRCSIKKWTIRIPLSHLSVEVQTASGRFLFALDEVFLPLFFPLQSYALACLVKFFEHFDGVLMSVRKVQNARRFPSSLLPLPTCPID